MAMIAPAPLSGRCWSCGLEQVAAKMKCRCRAANSSLTEAEIDTLTYGPGRWFSGEPVVALSLREQNTLFMAPVGRGAEDKVRDIEEIAIALGWSQKQLWETTGELAFPLGGGYGLVCFVEPSWRIGAVTETSIELVTPTGTVLEHRREL